ncbi:MAG: conjugal transfer protein TraC [Candidatus Nealsonbacteria bacterium RIFCSPLOWO2_12_FULL_39_31]|uniref:Conjugal transfer protein TraC n=3 Tax=Candidatus Nealsoniibacteriota TaxID=1817911 RepID=A0A1G2EK03_9BACT|nr:MAG: conjugal transfer protein TraC [Candidatus Nealsonbacteria bacterium RIFCSPHIGHO2_01_FULL_38_55]OGZ23400.1 MAG: conjugal transfer protein TraC [Candidatus Nealsonbacteria bacterium RIFCSPLOWO2_01_FULL_38_120]OGZ23425.1 MAG: conjugal transfer protein TraC [Candidatus Nealsonbacteria bacterium RIFCSPHIGHO2_12_FULL_38_18]OGZ26116.1 MAG: conjugal transfer protein TraC [Candidatus Nealsonbacteria bacterium RIFCSPLOWO2_02_39_8]OGZ27891.1 MAG: conjugal transfer protein TraC [Candidatus Nealson
MKFPFLKKNPFSGKTNIPETKEDILTIADIIAPSFIDVQQNYIKIGERLARTYFVFSYPRYLSTGWLSPIINLNLPMDISFYLHPVDSEEILKKLRKKVTEVQAELSEREEKGLIRDPAIETAYNDLEELRQKIQTAQERMFRFGLYITIYGDSENELREIETNLRSVLESRLIYLKPAIHQQKEGFTCTSPYNTDSLMINTLMNTSPLSSTFPFISFDLSSNEGILYGINQHNSSLVLFDRFTMANANSVIFATSGSGKSYAVKLEALRYLMLGVDAIIIDPDNEYKFLAEAVGGSFFNISLASPHHINPFDLPALREDEKPEDVLRTSIINLVGLIRIMLGGLSSEEDGVIDRALMETYAAKDITPSSDPNKWGKDLPFPTLSDLEEVLLTMEGSESLLKRLQRFTKGVYANFFNQQSNISADNRLVVFGTRDMEDELRPMALFMILRYIWKTITSSTKKRLLIIDEAWWLMKNEDGASFLFGTVKRARKYWLGVTTITQDVNDFMRSEYGQPIITNSALALLMKQSPATIEAVQKTFNITDEEKMLLLELPVGEGIFFAGIKHVLIKVIASYAEDQIITSSPEELQKIKEAKQGI